jgi:hypothetical protein
VSLANVSFQLVIFMFLKFVPFADVSQNLFAEVSPPFHFFVALRETDRLYSAFNEFHIAATAAGAEMIIPLDILLRHYNVSCIVQQFELKWPKQKKKTEPML